MWSPSSKPAEKYFPVAASTTAFTSRWYSSESRAWFTSDRTSTDRTLAGGRFRVRRATPSATTNWMNAYDRGAVWTSSWRSSTLSHGLEYGGHAHAAADAERGQAAIGLPPGHLVEQRDRDAGPRGADRMAQGDGATVDVQAVGVQVELPVAGQDLR